MDLVGFPYELVTFDVNEVCFDEGLNIPDADEKSRKSRRVNKWTQM